MTELIKENELLKPLKLAEIVKGKVLIKEKNSLFLDLGSFGTGVISRKEFLETKEQLKDLNEGDFVFAKVIDLENEEGYVELSIREAEKEIIWQELQHKKERKEIIPVKIKGVNKGGLLTEVSGVTAFLPISQLSSRYYSKISQNFQELQNFIDKEIEVQIIDLDRKTKKLILSEKAKEVEKIKEILKNYKIGDIVEGEISAISDFGAFLKFGKENIEGLIHISQLDWQLVENPSEIVKVGQKIKAQIIEINNDKIFLSLKSLKKDPWLNIEKKYKKGDKVKGKVIKLNPFGIFVQITPKIQALCHVSEFETREKMEKKIKLGQKYNFEILEINPSEHRMTLKIAE